MKNRVNKQHLIPPLLTPAQVSSYYSNEDDVINIALLGITAPPSRAAASNQRRTLREDETLEQLLVRSNLESVNAVLILQGLSAPERVKQLNAMAISQMRALLGNGGLRPLGDTDVLPIRRAAES